MRCPERGLKEACCNLTARKFRGVIAAELVGSYFVLPYIVAIDSCHKASMSLDQEEDVGIDDRDIR